MKEHFPQTAAWLERNWFELLSAYDTRDRETGQITAIEETWVRKADDTVIDMNLRVGRRIRLSIGREMNTSSDAEAVAWLEREFNSDA